MPDLQRFTALGFDFGMRRIGVAVGQNITQTATPLTTLHAVEGIPKWQEIEDLIHTWEVDMLVVGLPYNMDGTTQNITRCAQKFAHRLEQMFKLPVYLQDERLSTQEAKQQLHSHNKLKEHTQIDSYAAKIILESWLRTH